MSRLREVRRVALLVLPFALTACDGDESATGPVTLPPTIETVEVTVAKNGSVSEVVPVIDPDGDPLTYTLLGGPSNGTVTLVAADGGALVTYAPFEGFVGEDALTFAATDGSSRAEGRVEIHVVNTAPEGLAGGTFERPGADGSSVNIRLSATDADGDRLTFRVVRGPRGGELSSFAYVTLPGDTPDSTDDPTTTRAIAVYTALPGYDRPDDFEVVAADGSGTTGPVTVVVTVNGVPSGEGVSTSTGRDEPVAITLPGSDPDGDPLTFEVTSGPTAGTLSATSGPLVSGTAEVSFTPNSGFVGETSFTYVVRDDLDTSEPRTVTVSVANRIPVVVNLETSTGVETPVEIELSGSDADGDPLTFEILRRPSTGSVSAPASTGPSTATVTYTPAADSRGIVTFAYVADDGAGRSQPGLVRVELPPAVAGPLVLTVNENGNSVTAIDREDGSVLGELAVGSAPSAIAVSSDGQTAYVTNAGDNSLSVIDVATFTVTSTWAAGAAPSTLALTPDGSTALVAAATGSVRYVDLTSGATVNSVSVSNAGIRSIAISPDGDIAWVVDADGDLTRLDVGTGATAAAVGPLCCEAQSVEYVPVGLVVANDEGITGNDPVTGEEIGGFQAVAGGVRDVAYDDFGGLGEILALVSLTDNTLSIFNPLGPGIETTEVGEDPRAVLLSAVDGTLWVANRGDDSVVLIRLGGDRTTIDVGDGPVDLAFAGDLEPDGGSLPPLPGQE